MKHRLKPPEPPTVFASAAVLIVFIVLAMMMKAVQIDADDTWRRSDQNPINVCAQRGGVPLTGPEHNLVKCQMPSRG